MDSVRAIGYYTAQVLYPIARQAGTFTAVRRRTPEGAGANDMFADYATYLCVCAACCESMRICALCCTVQVQYRYLQRRQQLQSRNNCTTHDRDRPTYRWR